MLTYILKKAFCDIIIPVSLSLYCVSYIKSRCNKMFLNFQQPVVYFITLTKEGKSLIIFILDLLNISSANAVTCFS